MKIVFLAPFGIRPKGTVIARMLPLAVELQKLGHTVTIVAPPYTNPEDSGRTEVVRGVRLVNVALPTGGKGRVALILAWRMFRAALAEEPDIVHLFKPKGYGGLAAMLHISLQRLGVRLPALFLDTDDWEGRGGMNELHAYSTLEKRVFAFQEQWLSLHTVGVTVASLELERLTSGLGVGPERLCYLPNGIEDKQLGNGGLIREQLGVPPNAPVVLLYTRFFEFSQERLYAVLSDIFRRVAGVRFLVVGKGRNKEEELLAAASRRMGFSDSLVMAGWVEPEDINNYLAASDIALYLLDDTLLNRAKCPAKLTELLCAGVPVVADRVGQAAEYILSDSTGILCSPENSKEMADRAVELLFDEGKRQSLGLKGRMYLSENFAWRMLTKKILNYYSSLVSASVWR